MLIDFKSGVAERDSAVKLDAEEMRLQVSLCGIAARAEMEYEPEQGLVCYLVEREPDKTRARRTAQRAGAGRGGCDCRRDGDGDPRPPLP